MIAPLRLSFDVACRAEHAFTIWTDRMSLWWPADHTVSQDPDVRITMEPGVGGRIFERTASGEEFDWGQITEWEPPGRLVYQWHLGTVAAQATEVEVRFAEQPDGTTRVAIEHRGWDALGAHGDARRQGNDAGWRGVLPLFEAACSVR